MSSDVIVVPVGNYSRVGSPRLVFLSAPSDSYATITSAGYLNKQTSEEILATDIIVASYSGARALFTVSISSGVITMAPLSNPGEVSLVGAAVNGNSVKFNGTNGDIEDAGYAASAVSLWNGATVVGELAQFDNVSGRVVTSGVVGANVLQAGFASPDANANLVNFNVTVGQAALASGGTVQLINSSGSKQYKLLELFLNSGGTNFSGGGGDRLGEVSDGTTSYAQIPAATMQSLVNARWGSTEVPFPGSAAINTSTVAGADLVFQYAGGATDYTAGSLVISGLAVRVA